jgi:O-antigen/teichoic acid export membrane protein
MAIFAGSTGIFASWTIPTLLAIIPITWLIFKVAVPAHVERTREIQEPLDRRKIGKFIAGDYAAGLFAQASTTFMPIVVVAVLGPTANAYFYMAQVIGTALDRVSLSLSSSLTVEAAGDDKRVAEYARSVLRNGLLMVSAMSAVTVVVAPWVLSIFGQDYADEATTLLRLLALAAIPRVFSMVYGSLARLWHKTHHIAYITCTQAVILVGGSIILMPHMGVTGVGVAALASQALIVAVIGPKVVKVIRAA